MNFVLQPQRIKQSFSLQIEVRRSFKRLQHREQTNSKNVEDGFSFWPDFNIYQYKNLK